MAKRGAQSDLNRDNWDEDDGTEEAGTFTIASEEDINKRKIIKARRRIPSDAKPMTGGAFKNFTGFSGLNATTAASSSTNNTKTKTSFTGFSGLSGTTSTDIWSSKESPWSKINGNKDAKKDDAVGNGNTSDIYLENIKALNMGVSSWIQKHLDDNPYVDLTPVFNDYRKHLADIERKELPSEQSPDVKPLPSITPPSGMTSIFGTRKIEARSEQASGKSLNFRMSEVEEKEVPNEEKPFFGLIAAAKAKETTTATTSTIVETEEEPSDEPPKPKSVVSAEEGSKFSVRCKLFFNRNSAWSELGVGMLNIKEIDGKSQFLVRADTATGNILLNIFITSSTLLTRNGKNNVMLVSIPNPPLYSKASEGDNSKPATYLIRVKTADSADELFKIIEDIKSS